MFFFLAQTSSITHQTCVIEYLFAFHHLLQKSPYPYHRVKSFICFDKMQNLDLLVVALLGLNVLVEAAPVRGRSWLNTAFDDAKSVAKTTVHDAEKVDDWAHSTQGSQLIHDGEQIGKTLYKAEQSPLGQKVVKGAIDVGKNVFKGAVKAAPEVADVAAEAAPEVGAAALAAVKA